jgi:hypothetical protein
MGRREVPAAWWIDEEPDQTETEKFRNKISTTPSLRRRASETSAKKNEPGRVHTGNGLLAHSSIHPCERSLASMVILGLRQPFFFFTWEISPIREMKNEKIRKWSDLVGFNSQKWGEKGRNSHISTFGSQCVAIDIECWLKDLFFISGL